MIYTPYRPIQFRILQHISRCL